jgi:hypothetical protein
MMMLRGRLHGNTHYKTNGVVRLGTAMACDSGLIMSLVPPSRASWRSAYML